MLLGTFKQEEKVSDVKEYDMPVLGVIEEIANPYFKSYVKEYEIYIDDLEQSIKSEISQVELRKEKRNASEISLELKELKEKLDHIKAIVIDEVSRFVNILVGDNSSF